MLKIRMQRVGRVHEPSFRLVLTDSKNATKSGRFKEVLGSYDPRKQTDAIKSERIQYWLSQGVQLSPTVHNLLVTHKVISTPKIHVSQDFKKVVPVVEEVKEVAPEAPEVVVESPVEEAPAQEEIPEEVLVENAIIEDVVEEKKEEPTV